MNKPHSIDRMCKLGLGNSRPRLKIIGEIVNQLPKDNSHQRTRAQVNITPRHRPITSGAVAAVALESRDRK